MFKKNIFNYATSILLGVLIFASDFLDTDIFNFDEKNFAVWFVLSILCFASGWYINKTLGWHKGGKVVFSVIIAVAIVSMFMVTFFSGYFNANEILTENLVLYSLRNITLGAMGFFGMAIQEVINNRKDAQMLMEKYELLGRESEVSQKELQLKIREANLNAERIINDAEAKAKNLILKKDRIERELKEFIQTERELIKRYEEK